MLNQNKFINIAAYFALFICIFIFGCMPHWQNILAYKLPDSDDAARILEVRAWLSGQGFFDLDNHRVNPPIGMEMHWSRISDLPLALVQTILFPFFNKEIAEKYSVFITPIIIGVTFVFALSKTSNLFYASKLNFPILILLLLISEWALQNFIPGRVDHHALQLLSFIILIYGLLKNDFKSGIISGFALGISLTIGFELLPLQILAIFWLVNIWTIKGESRGQNIQGFSIAIIISILLGFFINTAPSNYFIAQNDRLSIAQILPIITGGLLLFLASKITIKTRIFRYISLFIIGLIVLLIAFQFKELRMPLYWQVGQMPRLLWLSLVGEILPLKTVPIDLQISILYVAISTFIYLIYKISSHLIHRKENKNLENWVLIFLLLFASIALSIFYQARITSQALVIALIIAPTIISKTYNKFGLLKAIIALIIISPIGFNLIYSFVPKPKITNIEQARANCRTQDDFKHLAALPKGLVAANISLGVETLLQTKHDILTTHFHRDIGKEYLYEIYLSDINTAKQKILSKKIDYIAICKGHAEFKKAADYINNTFISDIYNGKIPTFLTQIEQPASSDILVFIVEN